MTAGNPPMPVKGQPYRHQQEAFEFACRLFGLMEGGGGDAHDLRDVRKADRAETEPDKKMRQ